MIKEICYSDLILLTDDIEENVDRLVDCGANIVELLMDGDKWNDMEKLFEGLATKLREKPVQYTIHPPAWDINLTSENAAIREASFSEYKKSIQFASMINARHVVIHPGFRFSRVFDSKLAQERAKSYIKQLCEYAKPLNVKLAIENVGYLGSSIYSQEEFVNALNEIDETAGYLIDTGHAHINGWDIPKLISDVKDRLLALHLHDNNGNADDHLPIGEGTIDWKGIFEVIKENKIECEYILEYAPLTDLDSLSKGKELLIREISAV